MNVIIKKRKYFRYLLVVLIICIIFTSSQSALQRTVPRKNFDFTTDPYIYFTYQEMTDLLFDLQNKYPTLLSVESLGKTYENRDIWLVTLTEQINQSTQKPAILLLGAHHGNEKPSFEILIFFINYMLENFDNETINNYNSDVISSEQIRTALNTTILYIIPMVNPDGVEANTRKNREPNYGPFGFHNNITSYGVNLNRNYDDFWFLYYLRPFRYHFLFASLDSSFNYKGPYPFSSNETKAIKEFVETKHISISLSYHSYGEVMFFPWMHTSLPTPHEKLFISIGENMSLINNYRLISSGNYVLPRFAGTLGSSENWLYKEREILAYTMELCREFAPTNATLIHEVCLNHTAVHLYLCQRVQTIEEEKSFFKNRY
ncbi:MAG: M14 family zinc carboxypeptidase [Thermoplasmatota archaeon]